CFEIFCLVVGKVRRYMRRAWVLESSVEVLPRCHLRRHRDIRALLRPPASRSAPGVGGLAGFLARKQALLVHVSHHPRLMHEGAVADSWLLLLSLTLRPNPLRLGLRAPRLPRVALQIKFS
ncbi:unnamed protein product, partial [Pylaiella littoralis]